MPTLSVLITSSAFSLDLLALTSSRRSVGVMIPTSLPFSTTGILWILFSTKILATSLIDASGETVMMSFFMMSESCSSSNLLNTSFLETIPTSIPSLERTTGTPVSLFLTITLMASLRLPGTSTTIGTGVMMSATVFISSHPLVL